MDSASNVRRRIESLIADSSPTTQHSPSLSDDLIFEILTRVPIKGLLRFKSVCKQWRDWINSGSFQSLHLQVSIQRKAGYRFITPSGNPNKRFMSCSIDSFFDNQLIADFTEMPHPLKNHRSFDDWIVGSCNGLVCLRFQVNKLYLWNPCLLEARILPALPSSTNGLFNRPCAYVVYGFGHDKCNDDYKVLAIVCSPKQWSFETQVLIYTTKTDTWRHLDPFPVCAPYEVNGRLLNGALHWAVPRSSLGAGFFELLCIAAFDLETERFREVLLPDDKSKLSDGNLVVMGESLCVVCITEGHCNLSIWIMKEYGVKKSWSRWFEMRLEPCPTLLTPLWYLEKGELLLLINRGMVLLDVNHFAVRHPKNKNFVSLAGTEVYIESFVSPLQR